MSEPTGAPRTSTRKLVRVPDEGHLAGVCAGLARYFDVDPLIVRIAAVVLLFSGPGFFLYLAAWIFVPAADGSMLVDQVRPIPEDRHTQVVAIALIATAVLLLGGGWWWWWGPTRHLMLPLVLIGVGLWLLLRRDRGDDQLASPPPPPPGPATAPWAGPSAPDPTSVVPAPPVPAGTTGAPTDPGPAPAEPEEPPPVTDVLAPDTDAEAATETESDTQTDTGVLPVAQDDTEVAGEPAASGAADGGGPPLPPTDADGADRRFPAPEAPAPRRRRIVGPLVFGALLIWGGAAWLAGVSLQDGLAIGLVILGGGFVLGAFVGGSRGLVLPALLVGAALIFTSVVDIPWDSGIGDRRWEIDRASQLEPKYELGIGQATLDLGDLSLAPTSVRHVAVELGIGHLVVEVPDGLNVEVHGHAGAGDVEILGKEDSGISADLDRSITGSPDQGTVELDLRVGVGHIEVRTD